jgi:hypothetical protein
MSFLTSLSLSLDPCVAIGVLDDLVWNFLHIALDFSILELSANETLGCEQCVFWVDNCLALCSDTDQSFAILREADY